MFAAVDSTWPNEEPRGARIRTTSWSPSARLLWSTTVGTPCTQRRYSVLPPTVNACPDGWPTIRRSARWLPPATSTSSEAEFGGGVAANSPRKMYATPACLPAAIEPVAPRPTAATAVRARKSMRNLICTLLGRENWTSRQWSDANVRAPWCARKRLVKISVRSYSGFSLHCEPMTETTRDEFRADLRWMLN